MSKLETNKCKNNCACKKVIGEKEITKTLNIEFLYLDLNTCSRCIATGNTLDEALNSLLPVLQAINYLVNVDKVNITTRKLAEQYHFVSSPTIRVNGIDICDEVKESDCKDCGDLCGDNTSCRVFVHDGEEYEEPPVSMIIDGILSVLYGKKQNEEKVYILPENLNNFFEKRDLIMNKIEIFEPAMCCSTGLCGVNVDKELLRVSTTINTLQKKGASIERYNLSSTPKAFISNKTINEHINKVGSSSLPVTMVNGEIVKIKAYPTNEEFEKWCGIKLDGNNKSTKSCGCSGGCC